MHFFTLAFARNAGTGSERSALAAGRGTGTSSRGAVGAVGEQGRGHDEYFMPQSQTFSLTPEWRAQHFCCLFPCTGMSRQSLGGLRSPKKNSSRCCNCSHRSGGLAQQDPGIGCRA